MASLATHFTASLFLLPIGVRRLTSSTSLYLKNPSHFRSKPWYLSEPKWKNIDLYALLISLPPSSLSLVSIFLELPAANTSPIYRFSFLHQSFVVFLFWALAIAIHFRESSDLYSIPESFVFACAATAFFAESYLCGGRGAAGLSGEAYGALRGLSVACGSCCVFLAVRPCAFFAEFAFSCGLVLKGSWLMQVGFSLYTDFLGLKGCKNVSGDVYVKCELEDDKWRGIALMNLLLAVHLFVVVVLGFVVFGFLNRCNKNMRHSLSDLGSEGMLVQPISEILEIE